MFLKVSYITLKKFLVLFFLFMFFDLFILGSNGCFLKWLVLARLKAGREGDDRGWDGCMASLMDMSVSKLWLSWWWTGKPHVLESMGLQRVGHNCVAGLNWTESLQMGRTKALHDPALSYLFCLISYLAPTQNSRHTEPPFPPIALQNASTSVLFLVESSTLFPIYLHEL